MSSSEYRLPSTSSPIHYDLALVPDLVKFTFQGHLILTLKVTQSTNELVLNSADLTYVNDSNGKPRVFLTASGEHKSSVQADSVVTDEKLHRVYFKFGQTLNIGEYNLSVHYDGVLNDQLCGFYRSSYVKPNGETSYMATTQFEATDARRALPCYDEPAHKATFSVELIVPPQYTALSNMPVTKKLFTLSSTDSSESIYNRGLIYPAGYAHYYYDRTPIMSTYLLAFIVAELEHISTFTKAKIQVSVYTPLGKTDKAYFALDVATKALDFYESYFGIPYPLPKSDLVAIPDVCTIQTNQYICLKNYFSSILLTV